MVADPDDELDFYRRVNERQRRYNEYRLNADPELAGRVADLYQNYPWMPARVTMALARNGHGVDSPVAAKAAQGAARQTVKKKKKRKGLGRITGPIGSAIEDVGGVVSDVTSPYRHALDLWGEEIAEVTKPAIRGAFTGLQAGYEEVQGVFRNVAGEITNVGTGLETTVELGAKGQATPQRVAQQGLRAHPQWRSQSQAGIALEKLVAGEEVRLGHGFFPSPDSPIGQEQARRAREAFSIAGQAATPGRLLAYAVTEPGTAPYNALSGFADAGVALVADPANIGLGKLSKVREARRLFTGQEELLGRRTTNVLSALGLVDGPRKTVLPEVVDNYIRTPDGQKVIDWAWKSTDPVKMRLETKGKVPVTLLQRLADETDRVNVTDMLRKAFGVTIHEKPYRTISPVTRSLKPVGGYGIEVRRALSGVRILGDVPEVGLNLDRPDHAFKTYDDFQVNTKVPREVREANDREFLRALTYGTGADRYNAVIDSAFNAVEAGLKGNGVSSRTARTMLKAWKNSYVKLRAYNIDEHGDEATWPLELQVDAKTLGLPHPHDVNEFLTHYMPLPDARTLRRATSVLRPVLDLPGVHHSITLMDFAQGQIWKPFQLVTRFAYTLRVVGEEQMRIAASGGESLVSHPLSLIAMAVGDDSKLATLVRRVGGKTGKLGLDVEGRPFIPPTDIGDLSREEQLVYSFMDDAMAKGKAGWVDERGVIRTKHKVATHRNEEAHVPGWGDELLFTHSSPIGRRVANGGLFEGDVTPNQLPGIDGVKDWYWEGPGRKFREQLMTDPVWAERVATREGSDMYIDTWVKRAETKINQDDELRQVAVTGQFRGKPARVKGKLSKEFRGYLDELNEAGQGPEFVKGDLLVHVKGSQSEFFEHYDNAIKTLFSVLMARPTNRLSRSPVFRQSYWKRIEQLVGFMTPEEAAKAVSAGRGAKIGKERLRRLEDLASRASGELTRSQADLVAKAYALDYTRDLLYDLTRRSQFFDVFRVIFPFGEAWKELLTTWSRLLVQNPRALRRGQQIVQGARGAGFFYTDPQTGEEMFALKGSEWINEAMVGLPVPFQASVKGLSLATSVLPGLGPISGIAVDKVLPNKPSWDGVRDVLLPYGPETAPVSLGAVLPSWVDKLRAAWTSNEMDRMHLSTFNELMNALATTGRYDLNSEEGIKKLVDDANERAGRLLIFRGIAQSISPSAPVPKWVAYDKDGRLTLAWTLGKKWRDYQQEEFDGGPPALPRFLQEFGELALLYTQGKTVSQVPGLQATEEFSKWERRTGEKLAEDFPNVWALFGPQQQSNDDFEFPAWNRQIDQGLRKPRQPRERVEAANSALARYVYKQAKLAAGDRPSRRQKEALDRLQSTLMKEYPGYNPKIYNPSKVPLYVQELEKAVNDPRVKRTEAGKGLALYLAARSAAMQRSAARKLDPDSFATAKRNRDLREKLRRWADAVMEQHPGFKPLWDRVFERELVEDSPLEEVAA